MTDNIKTVKGYPCIPTNQCAFCSRTKCRYAIYTVDLQFVQIACRSHEAELRGLAEAEIGPRTYRWLSRQHVTRAKIKEAVNAKVLALVGVVTSPNCNMSGNEIAQAFLDITA